MALIINNTLKKFWCLKKNAVSYFNIKSSCKFILSDDFDKKDITNLMKLIWIYSGYHGKKCNVYKLYKRWAINALRKKRLDDFYIFI